MNAARYLYALIGLSVTVLAGCGSSPGQPQKGTEALNPKDVLDVTYGFAEELLATQKDLAYKLVDAMAFKAPKPV